MLGLDFEIILVDDGSKDQTWDSIVKHKQKMPELIGIRLSRNFGHQAALTAGLSHAKGGTSSLLMPTFKIHELWTDA